MRKHEMEVAINATAAEVWQALSTDQGFQSWFAPYVKIEPGVGGSVTVAWAPGMEGTEQITAWDPEKHLQVSREREGGKPASVVDYYIESRDGQTIMRMVHSGFGDDASFDGEFDSTGGAWPAFLKIMKHSTEQGVARCTNVTIFRMLDEPRDLAWKKLQESEELKPYLGGGNEYCDAFEYSSESKNMLGLFCEGRKKAMVTMMWFLYGATPQEVEAVRAHWTAFTDRLFGPHVTLAE